MMLIECYVAQSEIEGFGLFTEQTIEPGDVVYRFDPDFDKVFTRDYLDSVPKLSRRFMRRYLVAHPKDRGKLVLDSDNGRYMNHSDSPNIDFPKPLIGVALKRIEPGTELTANYKQFKRRR